MLAFFSLLDSFKTLHYNYNPNQKTENNNLQANFYNMSAYSLFFLQCIYGFDYNIISRNTNQAYYDSKLTYDNHFKYDRIINPTRNLFFSKVLYKRKPKSNRIFTIADFIYLLISLINSNSKTSVSYSNFNIVFNKPKQGDNATNQSQWVITISGIELDLFNLIISYLIYNKNQLPYGFNYKLLLKANNGQHH
ncbi:hypothetical protein [Helicobacter pylori]|uniref:hypothetical protein n=1 Tax=Helicobacter pylori TaxID=210 RepID=UPI0012FE6111|nr:hypothetical protein [Helicobacter pylori]WRE54403.1 hypothetical protein KVC90_06865 [Helicobacter pylori]